MTVLIAHRHLRTRRGLRLICKIQAETLRTSYNSLRVRVLAKWFDAWCATESTNSEYHEKRGTLPSASLALRPVSNKDERHRKTTGARRPRQSEVSFWTFASLKNHSSLLVGPLRTKYAIITRSITFSVILLMLLFLFISKTETKTKRSRQLRSWFHWQQNDLAA